MAVLTVDLADRSYPIYTGPALLNQSDLFCRHIRGRSVIVITNDTIAPLYLDTLKASLSTYEIHTKILPDGERFKSLSSFEEVVTAMLSIPCDRSTTVVALGGGVIGDLAGFVAASYQRGVSYLQVPTTLLAQVDSSVGGKTGINHPLGKNMIGAFYQPVCVVADTDTLSTLDRRQFCAGIAEVVKYGLLGDAEFFRWLEDNLHTLLERDSDALEHAILTSCRDKARVVAEDERESGVRALLNLGHTFGHAIESATGYRDWLHGEAVAVGMVMAADMSARLGWISQDDVERVRALLQRAQLPVEPPPEMTPDQFKAHMRVDKKVVDGNLRLVLLRAVGEAKLVSDYPESAFDDTLRDSCGA